MAEKCEERRGKINYGLKSWDEEHIWGFRKEKKEKSHLFSVSHSHLFQRILINF